jgi:hypothetical protein
LTPRQSEEARAAFPPPLPSPFSTPLLARLPQIPSVERPPAKSPSHDNSHASLLSPLPPTSPRSSSSVRSTAPQRQLADTSWGYQKEHRRAVDTVVGNTEAVVGSESWKGRRKGVGRASQAWRWRERVPFKQSIGNPPCRSTDYAELTSSYFPPSTAVSSPPHLPQYLTAPSSSRSPIPTLLPNDTSLTKLSLMPPPKKRPAASIRKGDPITGLEIRHRKSSCRGHTSTGGGGKGKGKATEGGLTSYHTFVRAFRLFLSQKRAVSDPSAPRQSFAGYNDSSFDGFGALKVVNEVRFRQFLSLSSLLRLFLTSAGPTRPRSRFR